MSGLYSTWLVPQAADARDLQAIIDDLAGAFGSPRFAAHMTVAEEVRRGEAGMARLLGEAAKGVGPVEAIIESIDVSDLRFRCLYARFSLPHPLAGLRDRLVAGLGLDPDAAFTPHVSLLYGVTDSQRKSRAREELATGLVGRRVVFDRLCLVASAKEIPVEDWAVRATIPLA